MKQIYLDSDDEITEIISKLEELSDETVALVPPKRSTVLQSVVNLKLLNKAAAAADVSLVLITRDPAILNVAAQLKLLTAPNLETEPIVPEPATSAQEIPSDTIDGTIPTESDLNSADKAAKKVKQPQSDALPGKGKKSKRVPDFDRFKKWILIGLAAIFLIGGGVWAIFALMPGAEIAISGRTQDVSADFSATFDPSAENSDIAAAVLAAESRQVGRTLTATFPATGEATVGDRATGQVTVTNCQSPAPGSITIESGDTLTAANGNNYLATATVVVPGSTAGTGFTCTGDGQATVPVQAVEIGETYNIGPTSYTVEGYSSNTVSGQGGNMTGGSSEEVTVISASDVEKARGELLESEEAAVKEELRRQFDEEFYVIEESFAANVSETSTEPDVGEEAETGRLILQVAFTMLAVEQSELEDLLESQYLDKVEDSTSLAAVETGLDEVEITATDESTVFRIQGAGVIGPDIGTTELKQAVAGMSYTEAIAHIEAIPNVTQVQIDLTPFWSSAVPSDAERINIEFEVDRSDADDTSN
ncbi:MAG: hypothetical protein WD467_03165 [Candidatus Saccharimonadales bacterium]